MKPVLLLAVSYGDGCLWELWDCGDGNMAEVVLE